MISLRAEMQNLRIIWRSPVAVPFWSLLALLILSVAASAAPGDTICRALSARTECPRPEAFGV
jgi:hypothetical protein